MIVSETTYNLSDIRALAINKMFSKKRLLNFLSIEMFIVGALFFLFWIKLKYRIEDFNLLIQLLIAWMLILNLFSLYMRVVKQPKIFFAQKQRFYSVPRKFVFDDVGIAVYSDYNTFQGELAIKYSMFHKVCETKAHFFVYANKANEEQVYIVPKSIVQGTPQELSKLLKDKMCGRFFRK